MKSPLEAPEKQISEETSAKPEKRAPASVIDTSKMSEGKRAALELSEASRDPLDERGSFASNLFIGRYDFDRIYPWPEQSAEDRSAGQERAGGSDGPRCGGDCAEVRAQVGGGEDPGDCGGGEWLI